MSIRPQNRLYHSHFWILYLGEALGPLVRYVKLRVAHASGMPGTFSPPPRVSDPGLHHGTCVTHVPWCMPGSLTSGFFEVGDGKNFSGIPGACATRNFAYLEEAHLWGMSRAQNTTQHVCKHICILVTVVSDKHIGNYMCHVSANGKFYIEHTLCEYHT